jgi:mono/diheme cytochrome c family protein
MRDQPSLKPYERDMPPMPTRLVPFTGGDMVPGEEEAAALINPIPSSPAARERGRLYYGYYCQHCHGADGSSRTPVGDSYIPMPIRLDSPRVQEASDGQLYRRMVLGQGHEPVMRNTVPPERRWYIVHFIRTLKR